MKQIIYVNHNNPEKTLNINCIYTIKLKAGIGGIDKNDIKQICYLRSIHGEGFKTHAIITVTSAHQAFGQIYALIDHCDRIYLYLNSELLLPTFEIFTLVYKTWKIKTKTKIYFASEIISLLNSITNPLNISCDPEK